MDKIEIIVLLVTIFVSTFLLAKFLNKQTKIKKEKKEQKTVEEKTSTNKEEGEKVEEKVAESAIETQKQTPPPISPALNDELEEFKAYLKTRITPENNEEFTSVQHSYETPKLNQIDYDDYLNNDFSKLPYDDDFNFDEYGGRKKQSETKPENLPNSVKILMLSDFFDPKF